jgi:hypothetical protein
MHSGNWLLNAYLVLNIRKIRFIRATEVPAFSLERTLGISAGIPNEEALIPPPESLLSPLPCSLAKESSNQHHHWRTICIEIRWNLWSIIKISKIANLWFTEKNLQAAGCIPLPHSIQYAINQNSVEQVLSPQWGSAISICWITG